MDIDRRYDVLRTISEGPRATVLQALDTVHDRLVALKVYDVDRTVDRDDLLAEARLLMSLRPHPALPVVRGDFFTADGRNYVVAINWVDGVDLQQLLEDEGDPGLPLPQVLGDLARVAEALDHLHAHDPPVVHGDVKPANILRTPSGEVVLVDFDIAGAHAGAGRIGTKGFVAPEVSAGEKPGPAADVFGLAATVVTLLNGRPPDAGRPAYESVDPAERGALANTLRAALAVDPGARPSSASMLVDRLRRASRSELPSGVVAFLGTEVADAARFWDDDVDEMRVAMSRLRDVTSGVVERHGGQSVTSMNEGDRTIAVFRDVSEAALAAIDLHDRVRSQQFPPGIDVRLRIAVDVGQAQPVDGAYSGRVIEHLLVLRSVAAPGTTLTSETGAELLLERVGRDLSVVSLGEVAIATRPQGMVVFGITAPGQESTPAVDVRLEPERRREPVRVSEEEPTTARPATGALAADALQQPSTLVPLTVAGLAAIYLVVLAGEFGGAALALVAVLVATAVGIGSFARHYTIRYREATARAELEQLERSEASAAARRREDNAALRRKLTGDFGRIGTTDALKSQQTVEALGSEFDAITEAFRRAKERSVSGWSSILPGLAEETYHRGLSALSDAVELLAEAEGPKRRSIEAEIADLEQRLVRPEPRDERDRARDEQRLASRRERLRSLDELHSRANDLVSEADRCESALNEARLTLADVRGGDRRVDIDAVIETLEATSRRVRDVQDEMRRLGYQ